MPCNVAGCLGGAYILAAFWDSQSVGRQPPASESPGVPFQTPDSASREVGSESVCTINIPGDAWDSVICGARGWAVLLSGCEGSGCFVVFGPYTIFYFIFIFKNWSIVDLPCCVSFSCRAKWFSYIYTYICIYILFQIIFPCRLLQNIEYSSLCYTVSSCSLFYIQECVYVNPNLPI